MVGMKDASTVNPDLTLESLGLDSLMVAEVRRSLQQSYDISMSANEIRALTFEKLHQLSALAPPSSTDDAVSTVPEEPIATQRPRYLYDRGGRSRRVSGGKLRPTFKRSTFKTGAEKRRSSVFF